MEVIVALRIEGAGKLIGIRYSNRATWRVRVT